MKLFAIIKWMLVLILAAVAVAGMSGYWLWQNTDRLVQAQIQSHFHSAMPDLQLHIGSARLTGGSTVRLGAVEIRDRRTNLSLLRVKELIAAIDPTELLERRRLIVRSISATRVDLLLAREADGRWNWQRYRYVPSGTAAFVLPVVTIEDVRAQLDLDHGGGLPVSTLMVSSSMFRAIPESGSRYDFEGDLGLRDAGVVTLEGDWDLETKNWNLKGRMNGIQVGQKLVDIAQLAAPGINERLNQVDLLLAKFLPEQPRERPVSSSALVIGTTRHSPRFLGLADLSVSAAGTPDRVVPEFRLLLNIRDGQLSTEMVSDILTDVRAKLFCDNDQVLFRLEEARDGEARISGDLTLKRGEGWRSPEVTLHVERFHLNRRIQRFLSPKAQLFLDHFQPEGIVSGDVRLRRLPDGRWVPVDLNARVEVGKAVFHKFRYPIESAAGTIRQRSFEGVEVLPQNVIFDIQLNGNAGTRPVSVIGTVRNPGPEAEMRFDVDVADLPIDSRFRDALDAPGRKVVDSLGITGTGSAKLKCYRAPGPGNKIEMLLNAVVNQSSMRFRGFPIDITNLNGKLQYDTRSKVWTFEELTGQHGDAQLTGRGVYRGLPLPGVLDLEVTATNAALDLDLLHALSPAYQKLWGILEPTGRLNLLTQIHWTAQPGQKPVVRLPSVEVFDAEIYPRPFPYRMKVPSLKLSFEPNDPGNGGAQHCEILSLTASHGGSPITAKGWAEVTSDNQWVVHLNDLNATEIAPDEDLRVALPDSWRDMLNRLSQEGRVSIESSELEFRGQTSDSVPPTAAWKMNLRLRDCGIAAGLDLNNVSGLVTARGVWDGERLNNLGEIRLDSLLVRGMTLTEIVGSYTMNEEELLLGNRDIFEKKVKPESVPEDSQVHALAYGGKLLLNALVDLRSGQGYQLFGQINRASLRAYAEKHIPSQPNLAGNVNAWLYLAGDPDSQDSMEGEGQMQISPAELYELPLMLELLGALSKLNFIVRERAAFNYALLNFKVQNRAFWFNQIDLVGDTLAMRGRGRVGFTGDVKLDFYSQPGRPRTPSIPLVKELVFATSTQWVGVKVTGTIDHPQTELRPRQQMDESLKQLLNQFQPNPEGPIPGLVIPGIFNVRPFKQAVRSPSEKQP
jgi:hypothetical protein